MEHGPLDMADAARLIRVIDLAGLPALCRLPSNDPVIAKRVLDAGAMGILVPCVESAAEARRAVEAAFYPPAGTRGVGLARAQAYGAGLEEYRTSLQPSLVVIAMVETRQGLEQVEAIAATPGLDGLFIGPYDLSASLGHIGQLDHPAVRVAERRVLKAARTAGIACGLHVVHPSPSAIRAAVQRGYTFLALGVDMIFLDEAATKTAGVMARSVQPRGVRV
jgi:2-dehydro-3-deoxyglucarate aldolase